MDAETPASHQVAPLNSTSIGPGSRVRLLVECTGETEGKVITTPPGAMGVVHAIDLLSNDQGVAVTVLLDAGIVNVFDHLDGPLSASLKLVGAEPEKDHLHQSAKPSRLRMAMDGLADAKLQVVEAVKPSASRLRMVMGGLSDPKLMVADAVRQTYGAGGSLKFGRDIHYVLRAFDGVASPVGA